MATIPLPCDGSESAPLAVRQAITDFRRDAVLYVHLLNVQLPFSAYMARFLRAPRAGLRPARPPRGSRKLGAARRFLENHALRADFHREQADDGLAPAWRMLDEAGVPHDVQTEVGRRLDGVADALRCLRCDRNVVGTTRRSPLVPAVENWLTSQLFKRAQVPVEVIVGAQAPLPERIGVPVAMATGLALPGPSGRCPGTSSTKQSSAQAEMQNELPNPPPEGSASVRPKGARSQTRRRPRNDDDHTPSGLAPAAPRVPRLRPSIIDQLIHTLTKGNLP